MENNMKSYVISWYTTSTQGKGRCSFTNVRAASKREAREAANLIALRKGETLHVLSVNTDF
jgi:hypothetical protein